MIVGGDFRKLLNALSHIDERTLTECLPFRPGSKGVHLIEAVAHAAASPVPAEQTARAVEWFKAEFAALQQDIAAGGSLARQVAVLGNAATEAKVSALLKPHLGKSDHPAPGRKPGLFGGLARLFKK